MRIERIEVWSAGGQTFPTRAKAIDYMEGLAFAEIKLIFLPAGYTESECFQITERLLGNRDALVRAFGYDIEDE